MSSLGLFLTQFGSLRGGTTIEHFFKFYIHSNWHFNHELSLTISPTKILCLKDYSQNLTKYEIKGTLKIPISLLFSEFKIW